MKQNRELDLSLLEQGYKIIPNRILIQLREHGAQVQFCEFSKISRPTVSVAKRSGVCSSNTLKFLNEFYV